MFTAILIAVTVGFLIAVFRLPPRDHYGHRLR
jgi:hypothetical protein